MCVPKKTLLELCELYPNSEDRIYERSVERHKRLQKILNQQEIDRIKDRTKKAGPNNHLLGMVSDLMVAKLENAGAEDT
jgi:hypothetical protein